MGSWCNQVESGFGFAGLIGGFAQLVCGDEDSLIG